MEAWVSYDAWALSIFFHPKQTNMKEFTFTTKSGGSYQVIIQLGKYKNGQTSMQLIDAADGTPVAVASIAVPELSISDHQIIVKDYSENLGMLEFLLDNNIAEETNEYVETGYHLSSVVNLLPESEWTPAVPENRQFLINGMTVWAKDYFSALDIYELALQAEQE
jgi:hypothetical protein